LATLHGVTVISCF